MLTQRPEYGLKKPPSYNYDFVILGISLLMTGLLGLPPNYGLIPQAPLHARALGMSDRTMAYAHAGSPS